MENFTLVGMLVRSMKSKSTERSLLVRTRHPGP